MYLRKLTEEENEVIKAAKYKANKILTANRRSINAKLQNLLKRKTAAAKYTCEELEKELEKNRRIIGRPVALKISGKIIATDYERLEKLDKLLNPRQFVRSMSIKEKEAGIPMLELIYRKHEDQLQTGTIVLYELPRYQLLLLERLPLIELDYWKRLLKGGFEQKCRTRSVT